jgi:hypothetical protein
MKRAPGRPLSKKGIMSRMFTAVPPPRGKGTMTWIGRSRGQAGCARAASGIAARAAAIAPRRVVAIGVLRPGPRGPA